MGLKTEYVESTRLYEMLLTRDQQTALQQFEDFINNTNQIVFVLQGVAGAGKTTLVEYIRTHVLSKYNVTPIGIAPTHRAKRILRRQMPNHEVYTVASMLQKLPNHSYIGTKNFSQGDETRASKYTNACFILDEVSMVSDSDFHRLEQIAKRRGNKVLAIGDPYQIPPITNRHTDFHVQDGMVCRRPCAAFTYNGYTLTEIVRQAMDSPILKVANFLRTHIHSEVSLKAEFPEFIIPNYAAAAPNYAAVKIIAYTNEAVETHNRNIRAALGYTRPFEMGDLLMGYQNIGYPNLIIENGAEYRVIQVIETRQPNRVGWTIHITEVDTAGDDTWAILFFPTIGAAENNNTFTKLVNLARKVNQPRSTKQDYARYRALKDKLFFLCNVYEYPSNSCMYYTESQLKKKEPILFTQIHDVGDAAVYQDMMTARLADNKAIGDSETFASAYCIIEKDLDYGYSYTAHKAQSGTLDTVIVDESNFDKIRDRFNEYYGLMEDRTTEKNQLKYVAVTRASINLYLM